MATGSQSKGWGAWSLVSPSLGRDRGFPLLHPRHRVLQRMRRAKANWGWSFRPTASATTRLLQTPELHACCIMKGEQLLTLGAHALEGYSTWSVIPSVRPSFLLSFRLSVCYHVFCDYAQRDNKTAIPTGSSPHWLHFKKGDFRITAAFESYGVKSKSRSQYAN